MGLFDHHLTMYLSVHSLKMGRSDHRLKTCLLGQKSSKGPSVHRMVRGLDFVGCCRSKTTLGPASYCSCRCRATCFGSVSPCRCQKTSLLRMQGSPSTKEQLSPSRNAQISSPSSLISKSTSRKLLSLHSRSIVARLFTSRALLHYTSCIASLTICLRKHQTGLNMRFVCGLH